MNTESEFNKQVENLIQKNYPKLAGISEAKFLSLVEPLKNKLANYDIYNIDIENGHLPFVIVVSNELIPTNTAMSLIEKDGKPGVTKLFPLQSNDFITITDIDLPTSQVYLLINIDRGKNTLNVSPEKAFEIITEENRSPLTIDEGVAVVTQYPEFLVKNNCFSLLASRHPGDKRVPAIWINSSKNPNLGWCWNGNPHTWLGSASVKLRVGV